jgi:hypothetical protein
LKAGLAGLAAPAVVPLLSTAADAATTRYTFTGFPYSSEKKMDVYQSGNGTSFTLLKGSAYSPPSSALVRDPSIFRHSNGRYYVTYTAAWNSNYIGLASSADRLSWTFERNITIAGSNINRCWAPEWFVDSNGSVHIILSMNFTSSASTDMKPYRITAANSALSAWSAPAVLSGINGYIDTCLAKVGSTYYAFCKSTTTRATDFARANSLTGPYTFWRTGSWISYDGEGPCVVPLGGSSYRMYWEQYHAHQYYYTDTHDTFTTWTTPAQVPGLTGNAKHGTVLKEVV